MSTAAVGTPFPPRGIFSGVRGWGFRDPVPGPSSGARFRDPVPEPGSGTPCRPEPAGTDRNQDPELFLGPPPPSPPPPVPAASSAAAAAAWPNCENLAVVGHAKVAGVR